MIKKILPIKNCFSCGRKKGRVNTIYKIGKNTRHYKGFICRACQNDAKRDYEDEIMNSIPKVRKNKK